MIFVFGSFLLAGQRVIAEFGIGLASAVFLDAFILRTVLVPATMHIIGKRTGGCRVDSTECCRASPWRASRRRRLMICCSSLRTRSRSDIVAPSF